MKTKSLLLIVTAIIAATLPTIAQTIPSYVPTNGLVAWYPFNGNANDESGNGKNGANYGASLTADRNNTFGKAYNFDGISSYIKIQNSDSVVFQNGITFSAWIMPTNYKNASIVDRMTNVGSSFRISTRDNSGNAITPTKIWAQGGNYVDGTVKANSISNIQLNIWQFVVGSYGVDDTIRIYINGMLEDKIYLQGHILNQYTPIFIGRGSTTSTYELFIGAIDDIGIWNRALTQLEITKLFNSSTTSLNESFEKENINVYPNPAKSKLHIEYNNYSHMNGYTMKITNALGKNIYTSSIDQPLLDIDLLNLSGEGIYFITTEDELNNIVDVRKVIIQ